MYLKTDKPEKIWTADIETDGHAPTRIWVTCVRNLATKEELSLTDHDEMREWFEARIEEGCKFVGHNFIGFDAYWIKEILDVSIPVGSIIDTFVMSMLYSPSLKGGHSLDAWGKKLKSAKIEFDDWSALTQEMIDYCIQDVRLNELVFITLRKLMNDVGFSEKSVRIEHLSWALIKKQNRNGFAFNYEEAEKLYRDLRNLEEELKNRIYEHWPPVYERVKCYSKAKKVDGSYTKQFLRHKEIFPEVRLRRDGGYNCYDWVPFDLASPQQRVDRLLEAGWKPREFTPKTDKGGGGNPRPTQHGELSPSLQEFVEESGIEAVKTLAQWLTINSRANTINTWMEAYNERTGCIHGSLWLAGSLRYKHSAPNTANIPRAGDKRGLEGGYTYESRNLWTTRDPVNRTLVGVDAKGIQLRVLANYVNNPTFTEAILKEDPHTANAEAFGLPSRSIAKTIVYAIVMGAGDSRIASEAKMKLSEAKYHKNNFLARIPEMEGVIQTLKADCRKTGRISLCDGSRVLVPQDYRVIPYLLQGDESRIMRMAKIMAAAEVAKQGLDVLWAGDIHDEWQTDVLNEHVDSFIEICERCFRKAGEYFNYNLPIECDAQKGLTWAETH